MSLLPFWPLPSRVEHGPTFNQPLDPAFRIVISGVAELNSLLQSSARRYLEIIALPSAPMTKWCSNETSHTPLLELVINSLSNSSTLGVETDESYTLHVPANSTSANISAPTIFGAMRGLETFSQLIGSASPTSSPVSPSSPGVCAGLEITDTPRFAHRELLIDTARYFFPASFLHHAIDAMSYSKLNVLHWHLIDGQSFPLESQALPMLAQAGAFRPHSSGCDQDRCTYTSADVAGVVLYGLKRGVRVIPEFDTPGHAKSWGVAPSYANATVRGCTLNADLVPIDPTASIAFDLVSTLLHEFLSPAEPSSSHAATAPQLSAFPDESVHLGGDEVHAACYEHSLLCSECNRIARYVAAHNMTSASLVDEWNGRVHAVTASLRRTPIVWEEAVTLSADGGASLAPSTIVQVWKDAATLHALASRGRKCVLAAGWYVEGKSKFADFYEVEPFAAGGEWTPQQKARVLGGGVSKWGCSGFCPFPDTSAKFDAKVWPLGCAVAERLWSPYGVSNTTDGHVMSRIEAHRSRLVARGVAAGEI
jgi:hexosaminidase